MTVEAYLRAQIPGYPFTTEVLENAALSPMFAKPVALEVIALSDVVEENKDDEGFLRSLKYALSSLYYSAAGLFSGGSRSEQVGDVRAYQSGFIITQADREWWRRRGDALRDELGLEPEEDLSEESGMFDATPLRRKGGKTWT